MNKERLLKLAELLEADAANQKGIKFDLGMWGSTHEGLDDYDAAPPVSISCGTTACAMGLAVLSGAFADAGLINGSIIKSQILPEMKETGSLGFEAAIELFDIRASQACWLFSWDSYPANRTTGADAELLVAQRIRELVADGAPDDVTA